MIVFRIHCNFFIVLPIRLKTYRSNVFLFFIRQIGRAQKLGPNSSRPVWRCLWEKLTYFKKSISFFGWFVWSSFEKLEWVERITKIFIIIVIAAKTAITFWIIIFYHYPITAVHPINAKHSRTLKNSPPPYLLTGITTVLLQSQSIIAS